MQRITTQSLYSVLDSIAVISSQCTLHLYAKNHETDIDAYLMQKEGGKDYFGG